MTEMQTTRTKLSVVDIKLFTMFLEANDMASVIVGTYDETLISYCTNTYICYSHSDTDSAVASMTYITIKYGSIEHAFNHFKQTLYGINCTPLR